LVKSIEDNTLVSYFSFRDELKEKYDFITLVSHRRHIPKIISPKKATLVVSSDWLLLNELDLHGYDAVYFEYGLRDWGEQELESKLFIRSNDWLYINGEDKTLYKGVSLGKLFTRDLSFIYVGYARLNSALSRICDEFKPSKIYFYDYRSEFGLLDEISKLEIVDQVCQQYGIELISCVDCPKDDDKDFSQRPIYGNDKPPVESYPFLRDLYGMVVEFLSVVIRALTSKRDKIALFTGGHLVQTLSKYTKSNNITPIYFSSLVSKKPKDVFSIIWGGAYLAKRLNGDIYKAKNEVVSDIVDLYLNHWDGVKTDLQTKLVRRYIKNKIFKSKLLKYYTSEIDQTQTFLERHQPKRIILDSVLASRTRIPMELSKSMGIKVDYIWHGYWEHIIYMDALGGDLRSNVLVDRVYTWGEQNERWLEAMHWKGECIRTGNPFTQKYTPSKKTKNAAVKNILILEFAQSNADVRILNANSYGFYVDIIRKLKSVSNFNIRLKLHPGLYGRNYYERITDQYSLDCEIRDDGSFDKHVDWADIVIGPVLSGAYLEVLVTKKPYYPVAMLPQSKMVHAKHTKFYENLDLLANDIQNSVMHNTDKALNELTSINQFPRPASALMDAIGND